MLFDHLNVYLCEGELVEILGPNGSGKSTLLRNLAGLKQLENGHVEIPLTTKLEYVGHNHGLNASLTTIENLFWVAASHASRVDENQIFDVLKRLEIRSLAFKRLETLSAGQRKRCALARMLISDADVWLMDEPYSSLDSSGREIVDFMLEQHLSDGGGAIVATHERLQTKPNFTVVLK